jgi:D-tyrosyl-tRNA(Tyr) deacylase
MSLVRAVLQRVTEAHVTVDDAVVARLDQPGLCVLLGITPSDTTAVADRMARKIHELRILRNEQSVADTGAPVLVVSQFTLYADTRRGRRPTWNAAAAAEVAQPLVERVVQTLRSLGVRVQTGRFGAQMRLALINDGPVTLIVDL